VDLIPLADFFIGKIKNAIPKASRQYDKDSKFLSSLV